MPAGRDENRPHGRPDRSREKETHLAMTAPLSFSLATWDYDRVAALFDGRVRVPGCDVDFHSEPTTSLFPKAVSDAPYDVTEMSFSSYLIQVARGEGAYIALPVFLSRAFRHNGFYVRADAGITEPKQLEGKRIGVPEYQMTAAVWMRAILTHEYGVDVTTFRYRTGGLDGGSRVERLPLALPAEIEIRPIETGQNLNDLLLAGELDALLAPKPPKSFLAGDPRIRRLLPDAAAAERAYYAKTGFFPLMHVVGIRKSLAKANPWLAEALYAAFVEARDIAVARLKDVWLGSANRLSLPWLYADMEATLATMGADYWRYGAAANRAELEAFCRYSHEQHLTDRVLTLDELFHPSAMN